MRNGRYVAIANDLGNGIFDRRIYDVTGLSMYEYMRFADSLAEKNGVGYIVTMKDGLQTIKYIRIYKAKEDGGTNWVKNGATTKLNLFELFVD